MIKKTITYTDYNGTVRTEPYYFGLTKAELLDMEIYTDGGLENMLQTITDAKDVKKIIDTFKSIVQKSYGVKSPDGKQIVKNKETLDAIMSSPAYSDLIVSLLSDVNEASEFINGILPSDIIREVRKHQAENTQNITVE